MPQNPELSHVVDQVAVEAEVTLTSEQKVAVLIRAQEWLTQLHETAYVKFTLVMLVVMLSITAVIAETEAAAASTGDEQQTAELQPTPEPRPTFETQSQSFEYNDILNNIRGEFIQAGFWQFSVEDKDSDRSIRPKFPVLRFLYIANQIDLGFGIGVGVQPPVFELLPSTYRPWVENTSQYRAFAAQFPGQEPEVGLVLDSMKELTVAVDGEPVLAGTQLTFIVDYTFAQNSGLSRQSARATITFTTENINGRLIATDHSVDVLTPQNIAEVTPTPVIAPEAAPAIRSVSAEDLAPFGPEVVEQAGPVLEQQVFVTVADHNQGLPQYAASLYPQLHKPAEFTQSRTDRLNAQQQRRELDQRDIRFGTVQLSEDGSELSITDLVGGDPVLSLRMPEEYMLRKHEGSAPRVLEANPDGTLLVLSGVSISPEGQTRLAHGADDPDQVLVFRWQAAPGAAAFAEAVGAKVDPELITALQGPSVQELTLRDDEEVVSFNDGVFGVSVSEIGVTIRQLAVATGFEGLGTIKEGTETAVRGSYPEQPLETVIPFTAFQNADVPFADIVPGGVSITSITIEQAPTNMGDERDNLLTIHFVGSIQTPASGSLNAAFVGKVAVVASTGQIGTGRTAEDPTIQYSFVLPQSAQLQMVRSER